MYTECRVLTSITYSYYTYIAMLLATSVLAVLVLQQH